MRGLRQRKVFLLNVTLKNMLYEFHPFSQANSLCVIFRKRVNHNNFIGYRLECLYTKTDGMLFVIGNYDGTDFNHGGGLKSKVLLCDELKQGIKRKPFGFRKAFT